MKQKNFGLTEQAFNQLLAQLQQDDETLIEEVYLKHIKNCVRHLMYRRGSNYDDAYNCATDALIEIRNELLNDKISYGNLESYFTHRSGLIYGKNYNRQKLLGSFSYDSMEEEKGGSSENIEATLMESDIKDMVTKAIRKLCLECQQLLELHYYEGLSFKKIAEEMDKKHDAVLQQVKRCREKFRNLVGEAFYMQSKKYFKG